VSLHSSPDRGLTRRDYLMLFIAGLLVALAIAALQPVPGYMDADYYYAGGIRLASGHSFTETILWNYLNNPQSLPQPSHAYWYPLASLIAAAGMVLTGKINFASARILFVLMAATFPPVTAALAYRLHPKRLTALVAGFLAIFSGFYLPFIVTTDNYGLYLLLGGIFFLLLDKYKFPLALPLGLIAGLLNLARGDGLLWLPLTLLIVVWIAYRQLAAASNWNRLLFSVLNGLLVLLGYLLVMGPWMARNLTVFGTLMPPGMNHVLWMTNYGQTFSFTPEQYTFQSLLATGWGEIIKVRASAFWQNFTTSFTAQGMIVLFPFILIGGWIERRQFRVQMAALGWVVLILAESILFPFASVRGGFFHAGAAFQPVWFALAPLGVDAMVNGIAKKNPRVVRLVPAIQWTFVVVAVLFSGLLVKVRVVDSGWNEGEYVYQRADRLLVQSGAAASDVVIVRNPPAYFVMTGRPAIVIPDGGVESLLAAAQKFNAHYLILEKMNSGPLLDLYQNPEKYPAFKFLGAVDEAQIYIVNLKP
jgi:hypothetical protein